MDILISWGGYALAILIISYILPGVHIADFLTALIVALILGILNAFFKPILTLFTLPINILSLGLFSLVIDTLLVLLTGSIVPGFVVDGFWWAALFALILAVVSSLFAGSTHTGARPAMMAR
jgi:putative membrane protein